jgi:hypothetical protein
MSYKAILITCLVAATVITLANSGGRASVSRMDSTGAPGVRFETCQSCHNSAAIQTTTSIEVRNNNGDLVESYRPGERYEFKVKVTAHVGTPAGYGFQMVALDAPLDENGDPVNRWIDSAVNVKLFTITNTGRQYAEHDGVSRSSEFRVLWDAPEPGLGEISFYAAGNGVNLNGGTSGDGGSATKISLSEAPPVYVRNELDIATVRIGPNPAYAALSVERTDRFGEAWTLDVYDLRGSRLLSRGMQAGDSRAELPVSDLLSGVYLLRIASENEQRTVRFVVE